MRSDFTWNSVSPGSYPTYQAAYAFYYPSNQNFYVSVWAKLTESTFISGDVQYMNLMSFVDIDNAWFYSYNGTQTIMRLNYPQEGNGLGSSTWIMPTLGNVWWTQWHHFVLVMSNVVGTSTQIYCDGTLVSTAVSLRSSTANYVSIVSTAERVIGVGCSARSNLSETFRYTKANMAEIGFFMGSCYNDQGKVNELYNGGKPQNLLQNSNSANLEVYWRMNAIVNTNQVADLAGTATNLTLISNDTNYAKIIVEHDYKDIPSLSISTVGSSVFGTWAGAATLTITKLYDQGLQQKHLDSNSTGSTNYPLTNSTLSHIYFNGSTGTRGIASSSGGPISAGNDKFSYALMWKPITVTNTTDMVFLQGGSTLNSSRVHGFRVFNDKVQLNSFDANTTATAPFTITSNTTYTSLVTLDDTQTNNTYEVMNNGNTYLFKPSSVGIMNIENTTFTMGYASNQGGSGYNGYVYELIMFNNKMSQYQATQIDRVLGKMYPGET
jgi:hypothetical protein